ncbi:hypothetical protein [Reyranella sp.]|uniref:hypothetical protein n=1 Tax=Reyranella sp. TaxID=1929291 RepID=UPI003BACDA8B
MTDQALLAQIGQTVWGSTWRAPMSAALKSRAAALADWTSGRTHVPAEVWKDLREITRLHYLKLADLDPRIVQAFDEATAREAKR